ncbi:hypothetical protein ACH4OY_02490 [Micromonospora rubida]|uniref:DUF4263 domain-containing protein n=1 Tax=Micromonospora rubida TaxID=2697657 RepID=A0ABW7SFQ3_9ACTN
MAYIVTLNSRDLASLSERLRIEQRLTKALPKGVTLDSTAAGPPIVLVLGRPDDMEGSRHLAWLGVVDRHNVVGAVDKSITVDPLRECRETVLLDGQEGLLSLLPSQLRAEFERAAPFGAVGECHRKAWEAFNEALRTRHPRLAPLLDWLIVQASPPMLNSDDPADRAWQEQQDAVRTIVRIADFPSAALAAWRRPGSRDAPYLAGLVPQPVEHSLIDHDIRVTGEAFGLSSEWLSQHNGRCDIHVLQDDQGRRLEVVNVNATRVEARFGTDMIYYHEQTMSFVLVQYKRLDPRNRSTRVDDRLLRQLSRLEELARLSSAPQRPAEWRLGNDPCFLKLAHWPTGSDSPALKGLTPGMYLPVSYVRLLLADDCTLSSRTGSQARLLGYDQVERHLVNTQFIELVKHGLTGTVGTTAAQLRELVVRRAEEGQSIVLAKESSNESNRERAKRTRSRGTKARRYAHQTYQQHPLF